MRRFKPIGDDLRMKTMTTLLSAYWDVGLTYSPVYDNMTIYATASKASSSRCWVLYAALSVLSDMPEV